MDSVVLGKSSGNEFPQPELRRSRSPGVRKLPLPGRAPDSEERSSDSNINLGASPVVAREANPGWRSFSESGQTMRKYWKLTVEATGCYRLNPI